MWGLGMWWVVQIAAISVRALLCLDRSRLSSPYTTIFCFCILEYSKSVWTDITCIVQGLQKSRHFNWYRHHDLFAVLVPQNTWPALVQNNVYNLQLSAVASNTITYYCDTITIFVCSCLNPHLWRWVAAEKAGSGVCHKSRISHNIIASSVLHVVRPLDWAPLVIYLKGCYMLFCSCA